MEKTNFTDYQSARKLYHRFVNLVQKTARSIFAHFYHFSTGYAKSLENSFENNNLKKWMCQIKHKKFGSTIDKTTSDLIFKVKIAPI